MNLKKMFNHFSHFQIDSSLLNLFFHNPPPQNIRNDSKSNKRTIQNFFDYQGLINVSGHQFP